MSLILTYQMLSAQTDQLKFDKTHWPTHRVIHYSKANWDGSNKGFVSVYFKDHEWIEALKWHQGHKQATIVPAKINHETFNVTYFKNFRCQHGKCTPLGEMYWDQYVQGFILHLGDVTDTVTNLPNYWHSYDFDFSSLMTAFLFKNNTESHVFERTDFQEIDGRFTFGAIGQIKMTYEGEQVINGHSCHLYGIDGPGLNHKGGEIWFDKKTLLLKGFKIKEPDESSYNNVDFQFLGQEQMSPERWENFKKEKYAD
jgi:hypothetical protein